jgi:hypothetical protein
MKLVPSPRFEKRLRRMNTKIRKRVRNKLKLFLENKNHPSLRYKTVQALKHENPPVKGISISMGIRITLQEFENSIYLRNIGGHEILL